LDFFDRLIIIFDCRFALTNRIGMAETGYCFGPKNERLLRRMARKPKASRFPIQLHDLCLSSKWCVYAISYQTWFPKPFRLRNRI